MQYLIISGSHREQSQSEKVSRWLGHHLEQLGHQVDVLPLAGNPYPLWDESAWDSSSDLSQQMQPVLDRFAAANGYIIVAPEWSGMVPGGLKNLLLYPGPHHTGHKPSLIVTVSAGRGGSYPLAELRMSSYKNTRLCHIPEHVIVQNVESVMNDHDPETGDKGDVYIKKRALYALSVLDAYTEAMAEMRAKKQLLSEDYQHGM